MDEKSFWKITPRKLFALMDCHIDANSTEEQRQQSPRRKRKQSQKDNKETIKSIASW